MQKRETNKARKAALAAGDKHYFTGLLCANGHVAKRQTSNGRCVSCTKDYVDANREAVRANHRKHESKNIARKNERIRAWVRANPHKKNAKEARRRAAILSRTPLWLGADDFWLIEQAYALAVLRTKLTGFLWHVDHVLPLQGKQVSGLHVPTNLQVIPAVENLQKNNRYVIL